jgi:hypothetical protein
MVAAVVVVAVLAVVVVVLVVLVLVVAVVVVVVEVFHLWIVSSGLRAHRSDSSRNSCELFPNEAATDLVKI